MVAKKLPAPGEEGLTPASARGALFAQLFALTIFLTIGILLVIGIFDFMPISEQVLFWIGIGVVILGGFSVILTVWAIIRRKIMTNQINQLKAENQVSTLIGIMEEDKNKEMRWRAAWALGELGEQAAVAVPALVQAKDYDESAEVSDTALGALGKIAKKFGYSNQEEFIRASKDEEEKRQDADSLTSEGKQLLSSGEPLEALNRFEEALQLVPKHEEALKGLARAKELVTEDLREKRAEGIRKIISRFTRISADEMAHLLHFKDNIELKEWLMELPDELAFFIEGNEVVIPKEKLATGTAEAEEAINALIKSFEDFEKRGRGKV